MTDTFKIKGVEVVVSYNDLLYNREEVKKLLSYGSKSIEKLDEIQAELKIENYSEVIDKLFSKKGVIEKTLDLTNYMPLTQMLGRPLETLLKQTFDIDIIECIGENTYKLRGPKSEFKDLEAMLCL